MEPSMSKFSVYSIGIVAENKKLNSDIVFITPIEITPFLDGELDNSIVSDETKGFEPDGAPYQIKVSLTTAIEAKWLRSTNSNRRTPPDVRRGERVLLWRYSDSDEFYWTSLGMDENLRKLETVVFTFSDTRDENKDSTLPENSYSLEVCTHTKQITLRTVKADGEPFAYTFQFNTKEGAVVLMDDAGNYFELDSADTKLTLKNANGTHLIMDKRDLDIEVPRNFRIRVGNNFTVDAKALYDLVVGGSNLKFTPDAGVVSTPRLDLN